MRIFGYVEVGSIGMNNDWLVYILECGDGTLYTGITNNLNKRLETHNSGKGAKYTRSRLPVSLRAYKEGLTRSEAAKLEYVVKKLSRKGKLTLINEWKL